MDSRKTKTTQSTEITTLPAYWVAPEKKIQKPLISFCIQDIATTYLIMSRVPIGLESHTNALERLKLHPKCSYADK